MSNLEQNTAIANEPREEIEAYLAARMLDAGFHVFVDKTDKPLTYGLVLNKDFEKHIYTASSKEVAQNNALEALCTKFDNYIDYFITVVDIDMSLKDYAYELYDNEESPFVWSSELGDWENIRAGILMGETKFLHNFLSDFSVSNPLSAAKLISDLEQYETTYLKERQENMDITQTFENNLKHGNVCEYDFYVVRLEHGHKNVNNLTFTQSQEEFSKMCTETPNSLVALGVSYRNAPPLAEFNNAKHTTG